jgi:hypothetical protein
MRVAALGSLEICRAGHDSVVNLRATLQLPSLDAVFAALTAEQDVNKRSRAMVAAVKARLCGGGASATPFNLFGEFFAQLFISESSVSDHQIKVAMIDVLTS